MKMFLLCLKCETEAVVRMRIRGVTIQLSSEFALFEGVKKKFEEKGL